MPAAGESHGPTLMPTHVGFPVLSRIRVGKRLGRHNSFPEISLLPPVPSQPVQRTGRGFDRLWQHAVVYELPASSALELSRRAWCRVLTVKRGRGRRLGKSDGTRTRGLLRDRKTF